MRLTKQQALDAYNAGSPLISDEDWDNLFMYNDGSDQLATNGKIKLPWRMGSLRKYFRDEDKLPSNLQDYIVTNKLDGCAGGLLYDNGYLVAAMTRGDGEKGQDITAKVRAITTVPHILKNKGTVWVTGELLASNDVDNPRNYVAGYLNAKENWKDKASNIIFVAYDVTTDTTINTYTEVLNELGNYGFNTVKDNHSNYPTDGLVYRLNDNVEYESSGFTGNYKNSAFALKERSLGVETTLLDIVWQTGKSGKVTPVAILDMVNIGGANVSRATLHNFSFIEDLGLYPGAKVMVERSGEIIPRIIGLASE